MELRNIVGICLVCVGYGLPVSAQSAACMVSGDTRIDAVKKYATSCGLPVEDCDPLNGRWYCSSENIDAQSLQAFIRRDLQPDDHPNDKPASQVAVIPVSASTLCVDTDGDGWGWDGQASCRVNDTPTVQTQRNQYKLGSQTDAHCPGSYGPSDITDLVLVTGQSNVTGADTTTSSTLDRWGKVTEFHAPDKPHPRVFAWTVDSRNRNVGTGWQVASLNQSWHDSAPGVGGIARNNFAFHFAKQIANRGGCKVVGFVMVSEGGRGISHWDYNAPGWNEVVLHVSQAMSAIGRSSIDGILWHQGESDWIADGSCYTGDKCQNNQPDYYAQKLYSKIANRTIPNPIGRSALIDRLRAESWYDAGKPFIAGETLNAPVNIHLNKLNTDNDKWTACVSSDSHSGLGIRENDPHKNHYNAAGLRELGARYASEYLKMTAQ